MPITPEEIITNIKRTTGSKEPRPCRRCQTIWTPSAWNLYDLCDDCFEEFNTQKMAGRMSTQDDYFESCDEWIAANPVEGQNGSD